MTKERHTHRLARMTAAALMTAVTVASATIVIPIGVVPITLQSGVALVTGALLGSRWGAMSQAVYVLMGLIGVPVFAGGRGGPGVVLSPTFGYLLGFIAAAGVTGWLTERHPRPTRSQLALAMLAGMAVLDAMGLWYLHEAARVFSGQPISWNRTLQIGLYPFLPFDAIKLGLAVALADAIKRRLGTEP